MAHWPRTVGGNAIAFVLALIVVLTLAQLAIAVSGLYVWIAVAGIGLVTVVLITRYRRAAAAHDLAVADAPSFADVLPHWNHREGLETSTR